LFHTSMIFCGHDWVLALHILFKQFICYFIFEPPLTYLSRFLKL